MASASPASVKDDAPPPNTDDGPIVGAEDVKAMKEVVDNLTNYKDEDGKVIADIFQRMVNRRLLPDYFDVIKEPIAFSTIRSKFLKKQYKSWGEFVRDVALISHNAQVYNRPSAPAYRDAIALREQFKIQLQKLVDKDVITVDAAALPDFGEIPPVEDSPPPGPEEEEQEEDEDEEDEEEEDEDSDEDGARKRRRRGRRSSAPAKRESGKVEDKDDSEVHKRRGRPPKVHTPMEARINALLKGMRKFKNTQGELKILPFEKLPDKQILPGYYEDIKNPMAMDLIKRKAKRKKYQSVDQALKDVELMFDNAKLFNEDDSQIYLDAVELQKEARILAEQEKKKPDSDFVGEDGRLPLQQIMHNGEIWKVGDWIHIRNPVDVTKPIVAQIYRTWQDQEGQKWINACWYYRPEQTVHHFEKHFYENEVVKTGQYRDHRIDEVEDRCFVMFFTRYNKGRPRGFPTDKEVYVCEARYNEEKYKLNKIKTWASCVPDEVREKDYEMDLFDVPRKMKKVPSPIKHLLQHDAKEDDPLPKPTYLDAKNAPPILGAVHRRPREANESPPPEPTPSPPPPPPPEPVRQFHAPTERAAGFDGQNDPMSRSSHVVRSPASTHHQSQGSYGQQFGPSRPSPSPVPLLQHHNSYGSHASQPATMPPTPQYATNNSYNQYPASQTPSVAAISHNATPNPLAAYDYSRNSSGIRSAVPTTSAGTNAYNPPRPQEVHRLSDSANADIAPDIRRQFHCDDHGNILFFTAPPLDVSRVPETARTLGHSVRYLAKMAREKEEKAAAAQESTSTSKNGDAKRKDSPEAQNDRDYQTKRLKSRAMEILDLQISAGTKEIYKDLYGAEYKTVMDAEAQRLAALHAAEEKRKEAVAKNERAREESKRTTLGRSGLY